MPIQRYDLSDFLSIQRNSFFSLLETGLIEEISKRNPITNIQKNLELLFYPQYYILTRPEYSPQEAIFKNQSYTSKLFVPAQLKKHNKSIYKWVFIGNIPLMTKRGHFILNGAARVIVNQILRSPGVYYQQKIAEIYEEKWSQKPDDSYTRFYVDLICMRGTWLRIEIDKEKKIWAQMKKGPKIPIYWFLLAMGLSEKKIFKTVTDSYRLLANLDPHGLFTKDEEDEDQKGRYLEKDTNKKKGIKMSSSEGPSLTPVMEILSSPEGGDVRKTEKKATKRSSPDSPTVKKTKAQQKKYPYITTPPEAWKEIYSLISLKKTKEEIKNNKTSVFHLKDEGRKWLYNRFMNPRSYDLGKQGRLAFNRKLGLNISIDQRTLTALDVLYATDYLIKVEKGQMKIDDIDHLKNRRVRTSGELIQIQIGVGLVRLEKSIRETFNKSSFPFALRSRGSSQGSILPKPSTSAFEVLPSMKKVQTLKKREMFKEMLKELRAEVLNKKKRLVPSGQKQRLASQSQLQSSKTIVRGFGEVAPLRFARRSFAKQPTQNKYKKKVASFNISPSTSSSFKQLSRGPVPVVGSEGSVKSEGALLPKGRELRQLMNSINSKAFNSAIREFFGTSALSQFMDQINPLAELTHKRRLSSMGPGGVTRDTATLAIRGIHPTHYGRICPIETPEGKNTGLVNSMTTYARVNPNGIIESPFYKVYKGQVQKKTGMYFFSAEQEEKIKLAAADFSLSPNSFLPKSLIPVRMAEDFTRIPRSQVQFIGVSPLQMISIATSLIPFLEHDDANRALMGSNMQRQAVPLIRPERPIVCTGLEARVISDSGHALLAKCSGIVTYVSSKKIVVYSLE